MPFWNGETLIERLPTLVDPFRRDAVDCAAYTLAIGPEVYVSPSEQSAREQSIRKLEEAEGFVIPPGQFAFLLTQESISMPETAVGFISMKASIKFRGLINVSGFHVDPGYRGRLIFAVFNAGPVPVHLRQGDPCFLIWYADLNAPSAMVKNGDPVTALSASHINGISGELHSIESLAKKIKDTEKTLGDRIHALEREGALYKVVAGIVLALAVTLMGTLIKDCVSKHDAAPTPAVPGSAPSAPVAIPPAATSMPMAPGAPSASVSSSVAPLIPPAMPAPSASAPRP